MNRRDFLGQVLLSSSAFAALSRTSVSAASGGLRVNFVGLMAYIGRSNGSLLVAMPGQHVSGHFSHIPFLMARSGSSLANALGMAPVPGVVAGAFDDRLAQEADGAFAYCCLEGSDLTISSDAGTDVVDHRATHLAQMDRLAPGKRVRSDLRRWSAAGITVRGGRLDNSAAHPDAGKVWSFASHQQPLTDATLYQAEQGSVTLHAGTSVRSFRTSPQTNGELWVVSAAGPGTGTANPKRLEHSSVLFAFFSDATPVIATCEDATGRLTLPTEYPCAAEAFASRTPGAARTAPPFTEMCAGGGCCI